MGCGDASEARVAAAGGVEVGELGGWVREEGLSDEVADAAGFEGAGWLEVFEFEEDATVKGISGAVEGGNGAGGRECTILRLWRARRILSEGWRSRVWECREAPCCPCSRCCRWCDWKRSGIVGMGVMNKFGSG